MENTSIPSNVTGEEEDYYYDDYVDICEGGESFWQKKADNAIQLYVFPIVIIGGSLCNLLAIIVLQTRSYRGTSTGFLMTALALADWGLLLSGILRRWLLVLTEQELDLRMLSAVGCKFNIFLTYFFQYLSAWTLALITIERVICVCSPFKCKELCSLKRIVIGWVVIFILVFAINMHFFWTYTLEYDPEYEEFDCYGVTKYRVFLYDGAHNWIDFFFPCVLPFGVIIGCNIAITAKLVAGNIRRRNMKATSKSNQTSSTTIMLLTVSIMFLIMVTPFAIYSLGEVYEYWPNNDARDCAILDFTYNCCYMLFNLNSAINFILYCASGTKFRKAFLSLFCPKKYKASRKSIYTQGAHRSTAHTNGTTTNTSRIEDDLDKKSESSDDKAPRPANGSSTLVQFADIVNESRNTIIAHVDNSADSDRSIEKLMQNGTDKSDGHAVGIDNPAYDDTDVDEQQLEENATAEPTQNQLETDNDIDFPRHSEQLDMLNANNEKTVHNDVSKPEIAITEGSASTLLHAEARVHRDREDGPSQSTLMVPNDDRDSLNIPFDDLHTNSNDDNVEPSDVEEETTDSRACTDQPDLHTYDSQRMTSQKIDLKMTPEVSQGLPVIVDSTVDSPTEHDVHDERFDNQNMVDDTNLESVSDNDGVHSIDPPINYPDENPDIFTDGTGHDGANNVEEESADQKSANESVADEKFSNETVTDTDRSTSEKNTGEKNTGVVPNDEKKNYRVTFGLIVKELVNVRQEKLRVGDLEEVGEVGVEGTVKQDNGSEGTISTGEQEAESVTRVNESMKVPEMIETQSQDQALLRPSVREGDTDSENETDSTGANTDGVFNGEVDNCDTHTMPVTREEKREMKADFNEQSDGDIQRNLRDHGQGVAKQNRDCNSGMDPQELGDGFV